MRYQSRRLVWGAVLACNAFWAAACGGGSDNLAGPEPPPDQPVDQGQPPEPGCSDGMLEHGGLFRVCFPTAWNGDLVLYAHGYVAPNEPLRLPDDQLGGRPPSEVVTSLGYAFATTSYRANGLVAPEAVEDLLELADTIEHRYRPDPVRTAVVGFSEGGLVAALAAERHPERFDGALAGCGPIGDFTTQLNYLGDFRIVFDYLFPGLLPGSAISVPDALRERWETFYVPAIIVALAAKPETARELIAITGAPVAGSDLRSIAETTIGLLWYNVFGTEDAQQRLGGQPLDNSSRTYTGSSNDVALNAGVARFSADPTALTALARFQTSGAPSVPIVTLHTTGDPIVPFSQSERYRDKVAAAGFGPQLTAIPVDRFGHCTFDSTEVLGAFSTLWQRIPDHPATLLSAVGRR